MSTRLMMMLLGESSTLFVKVRTDFEKDDGACLFMPRQINKLLIKLQNTECLFKVPQARSTLPPASRPRTVGTLGACHTPALSRDHV